MSAPQFTLGIEEEFQSVDTQSGELRSSIIPLLAKASPMLKGRLQAELAQSMIELSTAICPSIKEARKDLYRSRFELFQLVQQEGLALISAGTHPISHWYEQELMPKERYVELVEQFQDVVRSRVIFGLHVHIGIDNKETAIALINQLRTWLPHLLALSANSPFWDGRFTGIKSYRSVVWQSGSPRNGLPEIFSSLSEYNRYIGDLIRTNCITSGKDLWWDLRAHPGYDTIEFRICDMPATVEDSLALAALCQALVAKLHWLYHRGQQMPIYTRDYISENKWQALRFGLDGYFADFEHNQRIPMRQAISELLDFVQDMAEELGTQHEMEHLRSLLEDPNGTGADRQIAAYQQRENLQDVVHYLIKQFQADLGPVPLDGVSH